MAQMNLSTEKKQTHGHGEQTCGCQGAGEGVGNLIIFSPTGYFSVLFSVFSFQNYQLSAEFY